MIMKDVFKTYFDRYDTQGVFHNGFVQSIDLSSYVDFTFLNDLSTAIVDSYLYNEFSNRVVLDRWKKYMKWDKDNKRFIIDPNFYTNAVNALFVYLAKSEKFFAILNTNFSTLSATEIETINHGARSGSKQYGAQTIGRDYDKVVIELMRGTETENRGTHTDTETRGAHTDNETRGAHTDTETHATYTDTENTGAHTDTISRNGYTDTESLGTHTNTETKAQYIDSESIGARSDSESIGQRSDSESIGQRLDSESIGAQTIGNTKTEQIHPFDANAFVDDTKTTEETTNGAQSNSKTTGAQSNSKTMGAQSNSKTTGAQSNQTTHGAQETTNVLGAQSNSTQYGAQEDTNAYGAQSNSNVYGAREISNAYGAQTNSNAYGAQEIANAYGAQENTKSFGKTSNETKARTDAETRGAHTDSESVSAYIDTKNRTKVLILSPEKYYMILKELADKNIYTLFADAVNNCFLSDVFEFQALENGGIIL